MVIIDKTNKGIQFGDLDVEAVFKYENSICMKISDQNAEYNTYDFTNHQKIIMYKDYPVEPLHAELIITTPKSST